MESLVELGDEDMSWSTFIQSVCLSVSLVTLVERGRQQRMELEMDMTPPIFSANSSWLKET